jgi:DNA-binding transcriptional LysR family regulator
VRKRPAGCATDREVVVVAAVLAAGSEKAAAHRLGLSHSTVKHHLANARSKVGATTTARTAPGPPGHRAVEWLRAIGESFQTADVAKEKADLMHAIYEWITVAGPEIVGVRLTTAAYAHGLALALPERLKWRAR